MSTALVTGATAGIGLAFTRRLARERYDLVLVARDGERLEKVAAELRAEHDVTVEVLAADLADEHACRTVEARLADPDRPVDMLVNNAGFTVRRGFLRGDVDEEERMLRVLVRAVLRLTHAALPGMVARRHGTVVTVSSVAGFVPQSSYGAAKAWATSFTLSLSREIAGTGVRVQALCPGFTHTEFHQRASLDMSRFPDWAWLEAEDVVEASMADLARGRVVCIPGRRYRAFVALVRHLPLRLLPVLGSRRRPPSR